LLINPPAPLERELNFLIMGGGDFHGVKKLEAICCLSVQFLVMQDAVRPNKKENVSRQNKKWREQMGRTPYL
jgi:hypothetical protein